MTSNPFGQENDAGYCECSKNGGGCGRTFTGLTGFDKHMAREDKGSDWSLRCRADDELLSAGFHRDRRGWWSFEEPERISA